MMMTPVELRQLVDYDPDLGTLTWKPRDGNACFNSKLAGKPAFAQPSDGYLIGRLGGKNYKSHRVAWAIFHGTWPDGQIDHINGDRSDNRIANLRCVANAVNSKNQKKRSTNKSGEPCVNWFARDQKWWVKITADGHQKHIGYFDTIRDAVSARNAAWKEHGFHENHGR
jgi:hypothetical protein